MMNRAAAPEAHLASPVVSAAQWEMSVSACREITARHAKSFYFASHALPRGKREAAYAIYAFCRHVDDEIDLATRPEAVEEALEQQRTLLDRLESGGGADLAEDLPWAPAFVAAWRWAAVPRIYFEDLLVGMTLDQARVRIQDWPELDRYCYHVAGVVGLIMTHLFVPSPDDALLARARDLGTAMQLTNILRDVGEDGRRDRVYLPATELAEFEVGEAELLRRPGHGSFPQADEIYSRSPGPGKPTAAPSRASGGCPGTGTRRTSLDHARGLRRDPGPDRGQWIRRLLPAGAGGPGREDRPGPGGPGGAAGKPFHDHRPTPSPLRRAFLPLRGREAEAPLPGRLAERRGASGRAARRPARHRLRQPHQLVGPFPNLSG